jgi:hypothetical protein
MRCAEPAAGLCTPGIRGWRNLGWPACYVIFVVMLFRLPFTVALVTWAGFGVASGLLYVIYELIARLRTPAGEERPSVSFSHIPYGLLAWPLMAPAAIEYAAAELGWLPTPKRLATSLSPTGDKPDSKEPGNV